MSRRRIGPPPEPRQCEECGAVYHFPPGTSVYTFRRRQYCGVACAAKAKGRAQRARYLAMLAAGEARERITAPKPKLSGLCFEDAPGADDDHGSPGRAIIAGRPSWPLSYTPSTMGWCA